MVHGDVLIVHIEDGAGHGKVAGDVYGDRSIAAGAGYGTGTAATGRNYAVAANRCNGLVRALPLNAVLGIGGINDINNLRSFAAGIKGDILRTGNLEFGNLNIAGDICRVFSSTAEPPGNTVLSSVVLSTTGTSGVGSGVAEGASDTA